MHILLGGTNYNPFSFLNYDPVAPFISPVPISATAKETTNPIFNGLHSLESTYCCPSIIIPGNTLPYPVWPITVSSNSKLSISFQLFLHSKVRMTFLNPTLIITLSNLKPILSFLVALRLSLTCVMILSFAYPVWHHTSLSHPCLLKLFTQYAATNPALGLVLQSLCAYCSFYLEFLPFIFFPFTRHPQNNYLSFLW